MVAILSFNRYENKATVMMFRTQRNTMKNCNVSHSKKGGVFMEQSGLITIDGKDTTIHHNCTSSTTNALFYGLHTCMTTSSIYLASSFITPVIRRVRNDTNTGNGNATNGTNSPNGTDGTNGTNGTNDQHRVSLTTPSGVSHSDSTTSALKPLRSIAGKRQITSLQNTTTQQTTT